MKSEITGLVLAGGRATRMGGADKGLLPAGGQPLVLHALMRLAPQTGAVAISANRNLDTYRTFGVPVWPDTVEDFAGPLAGMLTAMRQCRTQWLAVVPCDSPRFPLDLVERLADAVVQAGAPMAMATSVDGDGSTNNEPVFCLLNVAFADSLEAYLRTGGRKVGEWFSRHKGIYVKFDRAGDGGAFINVNTPADLEALGVAP